MNRFKAMEAIAKTLKQGEKLKISVAMNGRYNHCDDYEITADGYTFLGHRWTFTSCGTLMQEYHERVIAIR